MEDIDDIVREIQHLENLQDDLYLDDVGGDLPGRARGSARGKKYLNWIAARNGRSLVARGRGRAKVRHKTGKDIDAPTSENAENPDIFEIDEDDLNVMDSWDLDVDSSKDFNLDDSKKSLRGRIPGRAGFFKRGQFKRGVTRQFKTGKSFPDDPIFDEEKSEEDMFDIESKSHYQQARSSFSRFDRNWSRDTHETGYPPEERARKSSDSLELEERRSPTFSARWKDPRVVGRQSSDPSETRSTPGRKDPRFASKQPDVPGSEESDVYAPTRKDPRLVPQQALTHHKEEPNTYESTRKDPRLLAQQGSKMRSDSMFLDGKQDSQRREGFEGSTRKDPRLSAQFSELKRRDETSRIVDKIFEKGTSLAPPGVDESLEDADSRQSDIRSNDQIHTSRRGPRSPSPLPQSKSGEHRTLSPSPSRKRERSPPRKRDRSPGRGRRSPSPLRSHDRTSPRRRGDSISPHRRGRGADWWQHDRRRSGSRDRRERSSSPGRHGWRDRSSSPRSRHRLSREWSGSPRRDRSVSPRRDRSTSDRRDRSISPRGRRSSFSPPHRSSLSSSRDEPWRSSPNTARLPPQPHYQQHVQQPYEVMAPPVQNIYNEGNYNSSTQPAAPYGGVASSSGTGYHSNYQQYGYDNYYQQPPPAPYSGDYVPPGPQPQNWTEGGVMYPDMSQMPPSQMPSASGSVGPLNAPPGGPNSSGGNDQKSEEAKKEAIKNELIQQKQTFAKQREEYVWKKMLITRELDLLREQEEELLEEKSRDNERILKENNKLQLEIQNKLKAINNVIDMLTGIIGDKDTLDEKRIIKAMHKDESKSDKKKPKTPPETPPHSSGCESPAFSGRKLVEGDHGSTSKLDKDAGLGVTSEKTKEKPTFNYIHYDPEMHWCRVCDVFPRTAKEFLNHLHSMDHKEETLERKLVDMPWHKIQPDQEVPHIVGAPSKRIPIKGLQFFISATAWYCKLCDVWIGDLHCASLHLKSRRHSENYVKFTQQNPHWETDWLAEREKAYERCSEERRRLKEEQNLIPKNIEQAQLAPSSGKQSSGFSKDVFQESKQEQKGKKKKGKDQRKKARKTCVTALDESKKKKRKKKKMKNKKSQSVDSSSSSSSSSNSSSSSTGEESDLEDDKSKSIRVTMRNRTKTGTSQSSSEVASFVQMPRSKWDSPEKSIDKRDEGSEGKEEKVAWQRLSSDQIEKEQKLKKSTQKGSGDDKLIREWMSTSKDVSDGEKQLLNSIKDRLKQKQEADREREREKKREERERNYYDTKGYYDDRRDTRRSKKRSKSPVSPSHKGKRSRFTDRSPDDRRERSSRHDKYDRHDSSHKSPERSSKKSPSRRESSSSSSKPEQKPKEEPEPKLPDKRSEIEKKIASKFEEEEEEDEESAESKFEKQTAESAAKLQKKSKKPPVMTIPKSKLPFIGRMPILKHFAKKKGPPGNKPGENKAEDDDKKPFPEDPLVQAQYKLEFTNVGGKVHIGPHQPEEKAKEKEQSIIGPELPPMGPKLPPAMVSENGEKKGSNDTVKPEVSEVQDMDIDEDTSNSDVAQPVIETAPPPAPTPAPATVTEAEPSTSPKKPLSDIPLPKDFQDALDILFPGQEGAEKRNENSPAGTISSPSAVIQSGPKPPTMQPNGSQMNQQGHWPQSQMGPMMQSHPMQGYGNSQGPPQMMGAGGPQMMGPMHGMHCPPGPSGPHPPHMQGPQGPGMYGPPGMPGPGPHYGMHGPPGPMMGGPQHNMMHGGPPMHPHQADIHPPQPPLPKEKRTPTKPSAPKKEPAKKPDVGEMTAEELAMLGIDAEDMAAQSF